MSPVSDVQRNSELRGHFLDDGRLVGDEPNHGARVGGGPRRKLKGLGLEASAQQQGCADPSAEAHITTLAEGCLPRNWPQRSGFGGPILFFGPGLDPLDRGLACLPLGGDLLLDQAVEDPKQ